MPENDDLGTADAARDGFVPSNRSEIPPELAAEVEKLRKKLEAAKDRRFSFMLTGRSGVGKSSTVNNLLGKSVAPVGDYEATTMTVERYDTDLDGIRFSIIDTPGLCDGLPEDGRDNVYIDLMRSEAKQLDSLWFVTKLDDTRLATDEMRAIRLITQAFTPEIWKHAVIVFTFANNIYPPSRYAEALAMRTTLVRREIAKNAGASIANAIPSAAVDNFSPETLDGTNWKADLYTKTFMTVAQDGLLTFALATASIVGHAGDGRGNIELDATQTSQLVERVENVLYGGMIVAGASGGAAIGAAMGIVGGPIGMAFGAALGGTIGAVGGAAVAAVTSIFRKFFNW